MKSCSLFLLAVVPAYSSLSLSQVKSSAPASEYIWNLPDLRTKSLVRSTATEGMRHELSVIVFPSVTWKLLDGVTVTSCTVYEGQVWKQHEHSLVTHSGVVTLFSNGQLSSPRCLFQDWAPHSESVVSWFLHLSQFSAKSEP